MKFLKVLANAILTGAFFSALLSLLVHDININLEVVPEFFGEILVFFLATYGVLICIISVVLFFLVQFILGRKFRIAVLSPSFLSLSFTLSLGLFLLIFKANTRYFLSFFSARVQELLDRQFVTLIFLTLLGFLCFYGSQRSKKRVLFLGVYFVFFFAAIGYVFEQRRQFPHPTASEKAANLEAKNIDKRVVIIGLEGLSFDVMVPLINQQKLPNFAWLMEEGTWGKLDTFSPAERSLLIHSFNTGKFPAKHRMVSVFRYRTFLVEQEFEVAPRFIFFGQFLRTGLLSRRPVRPSGRSKDIWAVLKDNKTQFLLKTWPGIYAVAPSEKAETRFNLLYKDLKDDTGLPVNILRMAFFTDFEFEQQILEEKTRTQPQIVFFMLNGLDLVENYFYKYSFPELFGNIAQDEIDRYSSVIERYYQFYDGIIGRYLASLKEDDLLVVFSPHGIEPLPLWKRVVEWIVGNAEISAYHDLAPDGVVFFYGKQILRGKNVQGMRLVDIAPTLLNYLGLPVGKDMDGVVFSSIFKEEFKLENPVLYISSYEEHAIKHPD